MDGRYARRLPPVSSSVDPDAGRRRTAGACRLLNMREGDGRGARVETMGGIGVGRSLGTVRYRPVTKSGIVHPLIQPPAHAVAVVGHLEWRRRRRNRLRVCSRRPTTADLRHRTGVGGRSRHVAAAEIEAKARQTNKTKEQRSSSGRGVTVAVAVSADGWTWSHGVCERRCLNVVAGQMLAYTPAKLPLNQNPDNGELPRRGNIISSYNKSMKSKR
jgi:hypothetical protein